MSDPCPCCGQPLPETGELRIDPAGIVVAGGRFAILTKQETAVLLALHQHRGRMRTKEQLLQDLYWLESEEPNIKIIDVWLCKLRKKLQPLGVVIQTVFGQGYRLLPVTRKEAA